LYLRVRLSNINGPLRWRLQGYRCRWGRPTRATYRRFACVGLVNENEAMSARADLTQQAFYVLATFLADDSTWLRPSQVGGERLGR